jgi:hypothetical protein
MPGYSFVVSGQEAQDNVASGLEELKELSHTGKNGMADVFFMLAVMVYHGREYGTHDLLRIHPLVAERFQQGEQDARVSAPGVIEGVKIELFFRVAFDCVFDRASMDGMASLEEGAVNVEEEKYPGVMQFHRIKATSSFHQWNRFNATGPVTSLPVSLRKRRW